MTHIEVENLASDYLEGLLDSSLRVVVEAHLSGCAACRELVGDVRHVRELCRAAEEAEPAPWLVSKILLATVGERKPTLRERLLSFVRPVMQPRVAYPVAMTVFTFSILIQAAGLNLRHLQVEDLNPRTWVDRADRQGHLLYARAEKFYYDLRVVYEIESRLDQLRGQPEKREEEPQKPSAPAGGSSQGSPAGRIMASVGGPWAAAAVKSVQPISANPAGLTGPGRSLIP